MTARPADGWLVRLGKNNPEFELVVVWGRSIRAARPGKPNAVYLCEMDDERCAYGIEVRFFGRDLHVHPGTLAVRIEKPSSKEPIVGG